MQGKRQTDGKHDREPDAQHWGTSVEDGWRESSRRRLIGAVRPATGLRGPAARVDAPPARAYRPRRGQSGTGTTRRRAGERRSGTYYRETSLPAGGTKPGPLGRWARAHRAKRPDL